MKKSKLRLTSKILETTSRLKVVSVVDYDPEIYGRLMYDGLFIGYVSFKGKVNLLTGMARKYSHLFIQLKEAS